MKTAFIYTGQGFQKPGMLHELPDCREKDRCLKTAEDILGRSTEELDLPESLKSNENTQICIYICETVLSRILRESLSCDMVSGHSIGSFAAAVESGVLCYEDGLRLVSMRGKYMGNLFPSGYGMRAVKGLTKGYMERLLDEFYSLYPQAEVFLATVNEELQCTVSGRLDWLDRFEQHVHKKFPAKVIPLHVHVPSHCRLMSPVTERLREESGRVSWGKMEIPYLCNSRARRAWKTADVKKDLEEGAEKAVCWYEGITLMKELGIDTFIEASPAYTLTNIGRRSWPGLRWIESRSVTG